MFEVSSLQITNYIYKILQGHNIENIISGKIYKTSYDLNNEKENIVIRTNSINGRKYTGVQSGLTNINIIVPANSNGSPKNTRITEILELVRTALNDNNHPENGYYFDILREGLFDDMKQNKSYYYNFTLINKKQ